MRAVLIGPLFSSTPFERAKLFKVLNGCSSVVRIGVDGGFAKCLKHGISPDLVVGDWDSLKTPRFKKMLKNFPHVTLSRDKDQSDLYFSILEALKRGADELFCFGVTGGERPDQHLATLFDLSSFSEKSLKVGGQEKGFKRVEAYGSDAAYIFLSQRIPQWKGYFSKKTLISVFAMESKTGGVSLSGFKYRLENAVLNPSSQGMSNMTVKKNCMVKLKKGKLLIVIPTYENSSFHSWCNMENLQD